MIRATFEAQRALVLKEIPGSFTVVAQIYFTI